MNYADRLTIREENEVHWVEIDRPGDRNALDSQMIDALMDHLARAEALGVRAIVYRGGGETYFIGGADGVEMYELDSDGACRFSKHIHALFNQMEASPILLLATIHGLCFGGGLEFALACDLRAATDGSRIGLPEVKLGIIPGGGGTQRLPRVVGFGRAVEMILGGRLCTAQEALTSGLLHAVVPGSEMDDWATEWCDRVRILPAFALSAAKRAVYAARDLPMAQGLALEAKEFAGCFSTRYFAERVREQLADGRLETTRTTREDKKEGRNGNL